MAAIITTLAPGTGGTFGGPPVRVRPASSLASSLASSVTYYYRTSAGARSSTTDLGAIPAGAVIERTVTT